MTPKIAISFHLYCKQDCIPSKIARGSDEIGTRKVHIRIEILYGGKIDRKDKRISDMSDSPKYYIRNCTLPHSSSTGHHTDPNGELVVRQAKFMAACVQQGKCYFSDAN